MRKKALNSNCIKRREIGQLYSRFIVPVMLVCAFAVYATPPSFTYESASSWMCHGHSIAFADYDNDGDLDVIQGNIVEPIYVYTNNGDGTFTPAELGNYYDGYWGIVLGDIDNDGDQDIVATTTNCEIAIYFNSGGGVFEDPVEYGPDGEYYCVALGDYDNDGDLDFATAGAFEVSGEWETRGFLFINNGDGTFVETDAWDDGWYCSLAWGDYDNDGDLDMAAGTYEPPTGQIDNDLFINNGDGSFTKVEGIFGSGTTSEWRVWSLAWGDYDNDGDLDVFAAHPGNDWLYINNADGTFTGYRQEQWAWFTRGCAWGDYDNDGDLDVAVANWVVPNGCLESIGNESFIGYNFNGFGAGNSIAWGDIDRDGDLDAAMSMLYGEVTEICRNHLDDNRFLSILPVGRYHDQGSGYSNRDAIGAKVYVYSAGHVSDPEYLLGFREIEANGGFQGQDSREAEFGLPDDDVVDIMIVWPGSNGSFITDYWYDVAIAQFLTLDEGNGQTGIEGDVPSTGVWLGTVSPNPCRGNPVIPFSLSRPCEISLQVFDVSGRLVKTVTEGLYQQGEYSIQVDDLSSGCYVYRLTGDGFPEVRKMVILK